MVKSTPIGSNGPWSTTAYAILEDWDAEWAAFCRAMSTNAWTEGVLSPRFVELVAVALCTACTNLDRAGARQHIRAALHAGATRDEILTIIKMGSVMAIHSCSLAAPILLEEAGSEAIAASVRPAGETPACDRMKAIGQWNTAWEPFFQLDPHWTDEFMVTGAGIYGSCIFSPKETELLSIAFDASFTHMYAPGTRRHIKGALAAGASVAEIMDVLKISVGYGVSACNLAVPILAEEIDLLERSRR
ncbi:carboxymuconolactone decarboxylase family protein [Kaistia algarum]|uniref:carboxymuconolactone decarboxylase family protein n=1 Tax=Kaistia algarum TaxID=2083279 RepID=UPI001403EFFA|nr:carboxymuconolactone decarboxylase family protein [Kaistia algarum]MCX5516715.1 carboxymuconolactone decarboxylase family protein [Kaistia algarum]